MRTYGEEAGGGARGAREARPAGREVSRSND